MAEAQSVEGHRSARGGRDGLQECSFSFCLASTVVTIVAGVQVSFGEYSMTFLEAWQAVFNPSVIFNLHAWSAFLFGTDLPEMSTASIVVWTLRMPRVFVAIIAGRDARDLRCDLPGRDAERAGESVRAWGQLRRRIRRAGDAGRLQRPHAVPAADRRAGRDGRVRDRLHDRLERRDEPRPTRARGRRREHGLSVAPAGLFFFVDDLGVVQTAIAWLTGSLTGTGWEEVRIAILPAAVAIAIALAGARQLNVLMLGESTARSLGMRVERVRFSLSAVAILAASAAIAVAGIVSFFGLVVPHIVRNTVGGDYRRLMIGCLSPGPH